MRYLRPLLNISLVVAWLVLFGFPYQGESRHGWGGVSLCQARNVFQANSLSSSALLTSANAFKNPARLQSMVENNLGNLQDQVNDNRGRAVSTQNPIQLTQAFPDSLGTTNSLSSSRSMIGSDQSSPPPSSPSRVRGGNSQNLQNIGNQTSEVDSKISITVSKSLQNNLEKLKSSTNSQPVTVVGNIVTVRDITIGNQVQERGTKNSTQIKQSFQNLVGISNVNQSAGGVNNQSITVGVAISDSQGGKIAIGNMVNYSGQLKNNTLESQDVQYSATINKSFQAGQGIAVVNQASGNLNHQFTAVSLSIGTSPVQALSNEQLGQINAVTKDNQYTSKGTFTANVALDGQAFKNFSGVAAVSQVAGNLNQVVNTISIGVSSSPGR